MDVSTLATHQGARKQPHRKDGLGAGPSRAMECYTTPDGLIMPHQGEMAGRVEDGCVARDGPNAQPASGRMFDFEACLAVRADEVSDGS